MLGSAVETNVRQKFVYIEKDNLVAQVWVDKKIDFWMFFYKNMIKFTCCF